MPRYQQKQVVPTLSLTAYAVGDDVGGALIVPAAVRNAQSGLLSHFNIVATEAVFGEFDLILFSAPLLGTYTDNGVLTLNATDITRIIDTISIRESDYYPLSATTYIARIPIDGGIGLRLQGQNMYTLLKAVSTPTYTLANALALNYTIVQD